MLTGAATVLVVQDIGRSRDFYRDVLGFRVGFEYGSPTYYIVLERDDVPIHLLAAAETKRAPGQGGVYIFASDVDALYEEFRSRGAQIPKAPQTYPYGMRDFDMADPDGNQLAFGMGAPAQS